jgi:GTP pyrophosphokinase
VTTKEGGPVAGLAEPELGFWPARARAPRCGPGSTRRQQAQTIARGREAGRKAAAARRPHGAMKREELGAAGLQGRRRAVRGGRQGRALAAHIEQLLRPAAPAPRARTTPRCCTVAGAQSNRPAGGVLVVGVDSLLTSLARCCRPAPPDPIAASSRAARAWRSTARGLQQPAPHGALAGPRHRRRPGAARRDQPALYPIDVMVEAQDRPGLLRDITEVFAKEKHQRHRRAHPERAKAARPDGLDDIHRGSCRPARRLAQVRAVWCGARRARRRRR